MLRLWNRRFDIDTVGKKIYFTESSYIRRANFDGTGKEIAVKNATPYDITIDWIGRRIFWSVLSASSGKINVGSLDGKARRRLITASYPDLVKVDPIAG
jgi:hypothetical protein